MSGSQTSSAERCRTCARARVEAVRGRVGEPPRDAQRVAEHGRAQLAAAGQHQDRGPAGAPPRRPSTSPRRRTRPATTSSSPHPARSARHRTSTMTSRRWLPVRIERDVGDELRQRRHAHDDREHERPQDRRADPQRRRPAHDGDARQQQRQRPDVDGAALGEGADLGLRPPPPVVRQREPEQVLARQRELPVVRRVATSLDCRSSSRKGSRVIAASAAPPASAPAKARVAGPAAATAALGAAQRHQPEGEEGDGHEQQVEVRLRVPGRGTAARRPRPARPPAAARGGAGGARWRAGARAGAPTRRSAATRPRRRRTG